MFLDLDSFYKESDYSIAILVAKTINGNNHCGIITKVSDEVKFYHLAWHFRFNCDNDSSLNSGNYSKVKWVYFTTLNEKNDPHKLKAIPIIKRLEQIHRKSKGSIPYALNYEKTMFDNTGDLIFGKNEKGLTCATFVACFFNSVGRNLIDMSTWPSRPKEDAEWKNWIIQIMIRTGVAYTHIVNVVKEEVNKRIKPEEITVSSAKSPLPADFDFCSPNGSVFNTL